MPLHDPLIQVAAHLTEVELADLALTDTERLEAGHPLPYTGSELVTRVAQLPADKAAAAARLVTSSDDAELLMARDRRKCVHSALLIRSALGYDTRIRHVRSPDWEQARTAVRGAPIDQIERMIDEGLHTRDHLVGSFGLRLVSHDAVGLLERMLADAPASLPTGSTLVGVVKLACRAGVSDQSLDAIGDDALCQLDSEQRRTLLKELGGRAPRLQARLLELLTPKELRSLTVRQLDSCTEAVLRRTGGRIDELLEQQIIARKDELLGHTISAATFQLLLGGGVPRAVTVACIDQLRHLATLVEADPDLLPTRWRLDADALDVAAHRHEAQLLVAAMPVVPAGWTFTEHAAVIAALGARADIEALATGQTEVSPDDLPGQFVAELHPSPRSHLSYDQVREHAEILAARLRGDGRPIQDHRMRLIVEVYDVGACTLDEAVALADQASDPTRPVDVHLVRLLEHAGQQMLVEDRPASPRLLPILATSPRLLSRILLGSHGWLDHTDDAHVALVRDHAARLGTATLASPVAIEAVLGMVRERSSRVAAAAQMLCVMADDGFDGSLAELVDVAVAMTDAEQRHVA